MRGVAGAIATAMELGIEFPVLAQALHGFGGVQRRFTVRADVGGVMIVDVRKQDVQILSFGP